MGWEIIACVVVVRARDPRASPEQFSPHCCILRLQGLYALGYVAIIDVTAVDGSEMAQRSRFVVRDFAGGAEFVMNGQAGLLVETGALQRLLEPANGGVRNSFVDKALREPSVSLNDLRELMALFDGVTDFLKLRDGLVEQSHFAESDTQVVVSFGILFGGRSALFKFVFQLPKHLG